MAKSDSLCEPQYHWDSTVNEYLKTRGAILSNEHQRDALEREHERLEHELAKRELEMLEWMRRRDKTRTAFPLEAYPGQKFGKVVVIEAEGGFLNVKIVDVTATL